MRAASAAALVAVIAGSPGASRARPAGEPALVPPPLVVVGAPARRERTVEHVEAAGWRAIRDRETGVVLRMWGGRVDTPGAVRDPAVAERAARDFVGRHLALLAPGTRLDELVLDANRLDDRVRTVVLHQTWRGLRVVGGYVHVAFAADRLFAAGSEALPHLSAAVAGGRGAGAPALRGAAATAQAEAWLRRETGHTYLAVQPTGERVVLPIVRGPGAIEYRVADVLSARGADPAAQWDVYVDGDGAPIARRSRVRAAAATLRLDVADRYPGGPRTARDAASANLVVDGVPATTAGDGSFTWAGTATAAVVPSATGTFVQIATAAGPAATAQLTAQPDQPLVWSLAGDELGDAQLAAYAYATAAKAQGRRMQPALAWLDRQLMIDVNVPGACNALSTGDALYFYRGSAACENTARLADVVLHEFGHSYHFQSSIFPMDAIDPSLSEGAADFFAAHLTGDPGVGRGFRFDAEPVRQLDPPGYERVYPADVTADPHLTGRILGGALWDLRKLLLARLPPDGGRRAIEQIFVGILRRASDLPSSYVAALTADDDDGDLGNGTPHLCEIELAFGRHGLAGPAFRTTALRAPTVDGLAVSVAVDGPSGAACPPPRVTGIALRWRIGDGPPAELAMVPDGATWRGALPPQPAGTVVSYQLAAQFEDGQLQLLPDNPADPWYQLFAGEAAPIWCEPFDAQPAWTVTGARAWEWAAPQGGGGDPTAAFTGAAILGTILDADGRYGPQIDTAIATPPIDASRYGRVHLQLRRWLTVEDAAYDRASISIGGTPIWTNASGEGGTLDHVDREWRFVDLDVTPYLGDAMVVSWSLASDGTTQRGGWNLDDVCLVGLDPLPRCPPACDAEPGGCCRAGTGPAGPLSLALALLALRRRRASGPTRAAAAAARRRGRSRRGCRSTRAGRADRPGS